MAETFVDQVIAEIDGVEMRTIKSISVTVTNTKTPVKTMNRGRVAIGVTQGTQEFAIKISASVQLVNPEQDWHAWLRDKIAKQVVYEPNGDGRRVSLIDVFLNSVDEKYDEAGEAMWDIDAIALRREED